MQSKQFYNLFNIPFAQLHFISEFFICQSLLKFTKLEPNADKDQTLSFYVKLEQKSICMSVRILR